MLKTKLKDIITLFRPYQYIKNLFIFAPLLFSLNFLNIDDVLKTFVCFIFFCLTASGVYIFNDIKDLEEDAKHPTKKFRPLPSNKLSKRFAISLMLVLIAIGLLGSCFINAKVLIIFVIYLLLNFLYSIKLKHIAIIDISIIAFGFVLRLFAGSYAINISTSMWIILVTFQLALFLAIAKRRDDLLLVSQGHRPRKSIDGYNFEFVNAAMVLMSAIVIFSYILYTVSSDVIKRVGSNKLYLTSFFVIIGILRYMQITFVYNNSSDPTKIVLKDRFLQITIILWLVSFILILLGGRLHWM
ncbi:UbiA prenyltransferase family protein [Desulfurella sp.]|uniref:UbiA prenyltransferase family protein n=1 Tax=Desulfurella sp. TaxID=1962857 RepID=UPI0025C15434|nr:UbiA prenyltransferase family protein [Desulfurella sp.]